MTFATQGMIESALASFSADGHSVGFNAVSRAIEAALAASPPAPAAEPVLWVYQFDGKVVTTNNEGMAKRVAAALGVTTRPLIYGDTAPPPVAKAAEPVARDPDGYAYRYPGIIHDGTVIRFNSGQEVNGGKPIEAIPYWLGAPPPVEASGDLVHQLRASLRELLDAMRAYEMDVGDAPVPHRHRQMMRRAEAILASAEASQQQASGDGVADYYLQRGLLRTARDEISRLTAERDALKAEIERLKKLAEDESVAADQWAKTYGRCFREREAAKAEAEALREALQKIATEQSGATATEVADRFQSIAKDALAAQQGEKP